jgi:hypothetical protein
MWELLLGTAAANKAVSVGVGLSVLLGAAGTAEMTGIGPAVREIVNPEASQDADAEIEVEETDSEELALIEESEDADHTQNDNQPLVVATDDAPGNLVWHLRDGAFNLRGVLVGDNGLAIRTAGPDGETVDLAVDAELVEASIPGSRAQGPGSDGEINLEDYIGYLVVASGECTEEEIDEATEVTCTVQSLQILGSAGQETEAAANAGSMDELAGEGAGESESQAADHQPEQAGSSNEHKPSAE